MTYQRLVGEMNGGRTGPDVTEKPASIRFGPYELDAAGLQLLRNGRPVRLKPQPLKLLILLAGRPDEIVTREEIRAALWGADTFVDFEQGVNSAVKQVRDALKEDADRPLYIETVPRQGYRFIAPIDPEPAGSTAQPVRPARTDLNLQKALWLNIAELRLAEVQRRERRRRLAVVGAVALGIVIAVAVYMLAGG